VRQQFDEFKARRSITERNLVYTFLIIGSLSARKGQESALRAIASLKDQGLNLRLIVAGSGREKDVTKYLQLASTLGISDRVEFTGFLTNPYEAYFKADCLLMCSEYEAFGRVTAEAMSACLPVIGKNSGGTPEIIEHEKTGLLYNTFEELVDSMRWIAQNPEWGRQLGLEGWRLAKERFNIEDYAANVYRVIQSVMKEK